tara:strand:+ start:9759 stop:10718 length:960 start_codon:yes stop_codon:yes gene_type:complete
MNQKFKAIIIGLGNIGYFDDLYEKTKLGAVTHYKNIIESKSFNLSAICDTKIKNKTKFQKNKINLYSDYKNALKKEKADLVIISTPDTLHYKILLEAYKYSPKMVFCEKPMCINLAQINKINQLYKKKGILLQVNYSRRFMPEFQKIKKNIIKGSLGNIKLVQMIYSKGLIHNGSHAIDLALWFFGWPKKIRTNRIFKSQTFPNDLSATISLEYSKKLIVEIIGIDIKDLGFMEINIIGNKGKYFIDSNNQINTYKLKKVNSKQKQLLYKHTSQKIIKRYMALQYALKNLENAYNKKENLISPGSNSANIFKVIKHCQS